MKFAIYNGKAYAVINGLFYPCAIFQTGYRVGNTPREVPAHGRYSEYELRAKLGFTGVEISSIEEQVTVPQTAPVKKAVKATPKKK